MTEHFIIPGAQRAGTSLLARLLDQHPEIEMAKPWRPELKYFLDAGCVDRGRAAYRRHFADAAATVRIFGEKSTSYLETPDVSTRIAAVLPDAKILIVLRDPIERAISNYRFSCANGLETGSIGEAFLDEERRCASLDWTGISVCPFAYLKRGRYEEHLSRWARDFPASQRLIVLFEQLIRTPSVLAGALDFLGVDSRFKPVFPRRLINTAAAASDVSPSLRQYLAEYFSEPNRKLAERFQLDLSCWTATARPTRPWRRQAPARAMSQPPW